MKVKELQAISQSPIWLFDYALSDYPFSLDTFSCRYADREIESIKVEDFQEIAGLVIFITLKEVHK